MTAPTVTKGKKAMYTQLEGVPLKMALLSPTYEQLHAPVMCKDYLQDAFWSETTKCNADVYGFKWSPGRLDPTAKTFMMSLEVSKALADKVDVAQGFINKWEKRLGFPTSTIEKTTEPLTFVLTFSKKWTDQPIRISLLTTLIRTGFVYDDSEPLAFLDKVGASEIKTITYADNNNVSASLPRIKKIWGDKEFPKQDYAQFKTSGEIHNTSGVVAYREK